MKKILLQSLIFSSIALFVIFVLTIIKMNVDGTAWSFSDLIAGAIGVGGLVGALIAYNANKEFGSLPISTIVVGLIVGVIIFFMKPDILTIRVTQISPPRQPETIYDDALNSQHWKVVPENVSVDYDESNVVQSGTKSIKATFPLNPLSVRILNSGSGITLSYEMALHFWVAFASGKVDMSVQAITEGYSKHTIVPLNIYLPTDEPISPNTWYEVNIPLFTLGVADIPITQIVITASQPGTVYFDDVKFTQLTAFSPPIEECNPVIGPCTEP